MTEPQKAAWPGVERLAHSLGLHTWYQGDDGFGGEWIVSEKKLAELRKALEPLLEAADRKFFKLSTDTHVSRCPCATCQLIRELDKWRK